MRNMLSKDTYFVGTGRKRDFIHNVDFIMTKIYYKMYTNIYFNNN